MLLTLVVSSLDVCHSYPKDCKITFFLKKSRSTVESHPTISVFIREKGVILHLHDSLLLLRQISITLQVTRPLNNECNVLQILLPNPLT